PRDSSAPGPTTLPISAPDRDRWRTPLHDSLTIRQRHDREGLGSLGETTPRAGFLRDVEVPVLPILSSGRQPLPRGPIRPGGGASASCLHGGGSPNDAIPTPMAIASGEGLRRSAPREPG